MLCTPCKHRQLRRQLLTFHGHEQEHQAEAEPRDVQTEDPSLTEHRHRLFHKHDLVTFRAVIPAIAITSVNIVTLREKTSVNIVPFRKIISVNIVTFRSRMSPNKHHISSMCRFTPRSNLTGLPLRYHVFVYTRNSFLIAKTLKLFRKKYQCKCVLKEN